MNNNDAIIARIKGIAATPSTPEMEKDPSNPNVKPGWKDPECPKCGLKLAMLIRFEHTDSRG